MTKLEPLPETLKDYRSIFESDSLKSWHLQGTERTFEIESVGTYTARSKDGGTAKMPGVRFKRVPLPFGMNKTNAKTVAQLYGKDMREWVGQRITLYPTTTRMAGDVVDCIRIRPKKPETKEPAA